MRVFCPNFDALWVYIVNFYMDFLRGILWSGCNDGLNWGKKMNTWADAEAILTLLACLAGWCSVALVWVVGTCVPGFGGKPG